MNILHIDSSILGAESASRQLSAAAVAALRQGAADSRVVYRDLDAAPLPHLNGALLQQLRGAPSADAVPATASEAQAALASTLANTLASEVALSGALVDELLAANVIVIGAPMYNFSVPSTLKAWIDRVAQPGRTFSYGENGPKGLLGGRRVIVISARGGAMAGTPYEAAMDHQEAYMKAFFGLLGISDIEIVRAENLARGPFARGAAMETALAQAGALAAAAV
jgi:FMN-dependent NADH-azoreductase